MTEKEKMLAGKLYRAQDAELATAFAKAKKLTRQFNQASEDQLSYRDELLKELFEKTGPKIYIEPPFRCDYGCHTSIGDNFYANYDCIIIDVCKVTIGSNVFFGPRVGIYTAAHPIDPGVRNASLEFGKPVTIGNDVWIGASVIVNPGVTIGNNVVIGSGAVVTKNIPDNVVAVGNPCRVLRPIGEDDRMYWKERQEEYNQG
jgi:maltose O-acetyltransferase